MPRLSRRALKDLDDLPPALREKALAVIGQLDQNPALGKKLLGALKGKRSARLGRSHRIIYRLDNAGTPEVLTVRSRQDAYR